MAKPHAVLWENGQLRDLGVPPGDTSSDAIAINDSGVVVGVSLRRGDRERVFLWKNGKINDLAGFPGFATCEPLAVNGTGQVLGYCETASPPQKYRLHAVLWHDNGVSGISIGGSWVKPVGLNDRGQVVGMTTGPNGHPFLWEGGKMRDLGTLGGARAEPAAINDHGQIIGYSTRPSGTEHAFLWQNGAMIDLGTLPGGRDSYARAINNHGQIIGSSTTENGQTHAVLWTLQSGG